MKRPHALRMNASGRSWIPKAATCNSSISYERIALFSTSCLDDDHRDDCAVGRECCCVCLSVVPTRVVSSARATEPARNAIHLLPTDGDAEVWKDRGAPFGIPFSIRDLSSKSTNAPGELLEKTMIAKEENVSSVRASSDTSTCFRNTISRKPTQEHLLSRSPLHALTGKGSTTQVKFCRGDQNHSSPAHCEQLVASDVLLAPEVFSETFVFFFGDFWM